MNVRGLPPFGYLRRPRQKALALTLAAGVACVSLTWRASSAELELEVTLPGSGSSQPLALTGNSNFLGAVNPDKNTVSFFDLRGDFNQKIAEVPVGKEPNGIAILPNNTKAYVANTVSGTVSVMNISLAQGVANPPFKNIPVGAEPYGLVMAPNGTKLYVSNARAASVTVIDTVSDAVVKVIPTKLEPRGLAITNDGDTNDNDETLFVTQFLSLPKPGRLDGEDDAKEAFVTVISTATDTVTNSVTLNPIADTGFKSFGDAIARIPPGPNAIFTTGAYPNALNNVAIKGNFAYMPNTGASPNGPFRFDVNTQSLLSYLNVQTKLEAAPSVNMHKAVADQTNPSKLFITQPWAMAFRNAANAGYVVSAASDILVKVNVNPATGKPVVQNDPSDPTRVLQIKTGKNPRGIVVNRNDTRAYVMNYVSRDITIVDLTRSPERVIGAMQSSALPAPGTLADKIHIGKELYNSSVGTFDPPPGSTTPIVGRMSNNGWGSCGSCHPNNGLSDNVVWIFPSGPKRTISQHTDFDQTDPQRKIQRALNWNAERDEEEDFELNIRAVSGGQGLIVLPDGITQDPNVKNFDPASGGRNQLKVRGVPAWDAIKAFEQFGIRAPISPVIKSDVDVQQGRQLFAAANCQKCHGGPQWTTSRVRFTPPPPAGQVDARGQLFGELRKVGTFNPTLINEVRHDVSAPPVGDDGFAPASLLSVFMSGGSFFHNGAANSLAQAMLNVEHRSAGTNGVDTLGNPADREKLIRFVRSIDARSVPFPLP